MDQHFCAGSAEGCVAPEVAARFRLYRIVIIAALVAALWLLGLVFGGGEPPSGSGADAAETEVE